MNHPDYPTSVEVDMWCEEVRGAASALNLSAERVDTDPYSFRMGARHHAGAHYVKFTSAAVSPFYGYWQPALSGGPAPLLVHTPGYGAAMSAHPELVAAGYNVLHVSPLGYGTPDGPDTTKQVDGEWPVLPDTLRSLGKDGYCHWLAQAVAAIAWAQAQPCVQADRLGTLGTSQGGGGSLLLGSILADHGVKAVCADEPFCTDFAGMHGKPGNGAYSFTSERLAGMPPETLAGVWRALGFIDTRSHAHRLAMPVLLTSGTADTVTPPASIEALFGDLPGTRSYTSLAGQAHGYTAPFLRLAEAWFRCWV